MRLNRSIAISVLAVAGLLAAGCSSSGPAGTESNPASPDQHSTTVLTTAIPQVPPMLDTILTTYTPSGWIMRNVVEGLVTSDIEYNVQPMLAEDWSFSDDGHSATFTLREGVKFHNGDTMTAGDVVASMQRWTDLSSAGQTSTPGATWSVVDDNTVKVDLEEPNAVLLQVMASGGNNLAGIFPESIVQKYGGDPIDELIGTGPYELAEYKPDEVIKLERFADYSNREEAPSGLAGDRTPAHDAIEFVQVADAQARIGGALTEQYDLTIASAEDYSKIVDADNIEPVLNWAGSLYLNYNKSAGPMSTIEIRQAANAAIGAQEIMAAFQPSPDLYDIRPGIMLKSQEKQWDSDADADSYNMDDSELAQNILSETAYAGESIRLMAQQNDPGAKAAVVAQQQLEGAGFTTELKIVDSSTYLSLRDVPEEWDILVAGMNSKLEPGAMAYFTPSFAGWTDDASLTKILKDYRAAVSFEDAQAMYGDILKGYADYRVATKVADWTDVLAVKIGMGDSPVHDSQVVFWSVPVVD